MKGYTEVDYKVDKSCICPYCITPTLLTVCVHIHAHTHTLSVVIGSVI